MHFKVDLAEAARALEAKIAEMVAGLDVQIRRRFERVAASRGRVVVPVIDGVCYGCFVSIATATAGEVGPNDVLKTCEGCGRFIYIVP
ncbi:MAG: hypothetical protein EXR95_08505 [Gemmatimonadetes bacterium]|nr:hypothetical protein [Gemmatimonadota bacterium]